MSPNIFLYFDYPQGEQGNQQEPFIGHRPKVTVGTVYGYEPYADELTGEQRAHIKGVQANMWTEYLPAPENVEYMLMPRIDALSEVQWVSEGRKDYDAFLVRLRRMAALYDKFGYNYARHAFVE